MANMINKSIPEFTAQAFHNGEFKEVTTEDVKGKWAIFLFYPADFTFVCPTELGECLFEIRQGQRYFVRAAS